MTATTIDNESRRELTMYAENDSELYRAYATPIIKNLARKMLRGIYDAEKAPRAFYTMADQAARKYCREFANIDDMPQVFNAATRRATAADLLQGYTDEITEQAEAMKAAKAAK